MVDNGIRTTFENGYFQGSTWFIDGTVTTVTTGRDGTVKRSSKWNRGPVPSHPVVNLTYR